MLINGTTVRSTLMQSLAETASRCEDRPELARWFQDGLRTKDGPLNMGDVELAVIEEILTSISRGKNVTIVNPLPGNEVLLGVCLGYLRVQNPSFPRKGIVGQGKSLCLLPSLSRGYVTLFDEVRRNGIGKTPPLLDRTSIDKMSSVSGSASLLTAKHGVELDNCPSDLGVLVIDLRKKEWRDPRRRLEELKSYVKGLSIPVVYYMNEAQPAFESILSNTQHIKLNNTLLSTARVNENTDVSVASQYAQILSSGERRVGLQRVHYPKMRSVVTDLANMKQDLRHVPGLAVEVGWLFNLLTELPVRPQHWEDAVKDNYHHQSVGDLIANLRGKAQNLDGMTADLLINYCQAASYLQQLLNTKHPLQEALFERISDAEEAGTLARFVVRNEYETKAIMNALAAEGGTMPDTTEIVPIADLVPDPDKPTVITRPLGQSSHIYSFPASRSMEFLQFEMWADHVERRLERELAETDTTIEVKNHNEPKEPPEQNTARAGAGSPTPGSPQAAQRSPQDADKELQEVVEEASPTDASTAASIGEKNYETPDYENANELLDEVLEAEFSGESASTQSGPTGEASGETGQAHTDNTLKIVFSDGTTRTQSSLSRVTVTSEGGIVRVPVAELEPGDEVLLMDDSSGDLYDVFIESAHDRERVRGCESTIDRWRTVLKEGLDDEYTVEGLLREMQSEGSDISTTDTIVNWRSGRTLGPRNAENVRLVLEILDPSATSLAEPTISALREIRTLHRQIGKEAKRSLEAGIATDSSLPDEVADNDTDIEANTMEKIVEDVIDVE